MAFDLTEKRYVRETGLEARISRIVEPVANDLGYALVRVKVTQDNGCTLQIMAEDANGRFAINDCERLSKDLSPVLDVEDPIDREYHLEVSSPGIDRPLVRARDYRTYIGHEAKIELADAVAGRDVEIVTTDQFTLDVTGLRASRIGDIAAERGIAVHELTPTSGSREDAYLALTGDAVEYRTRTVTDTDQQDGAPLEEARA